MTTDNWINFVAAILVGGGTFFLGIMAWRTIRQNSNIHKAEKRERMLIEIIRWVTDVIANWHNIDVESECSVHHNIDENMFFNWRDIVARSDNVEIIASFFGEDLRSTVNKIKWNIMDTTEWIRSCRRGDVTAEMKEEDSVKLVNTKDMVYENLEELFKNACDLLEKIGKISVSELDL